MIKTRERMIAEFKEKIEVLDRDIKWWMISDSEEESDNHLTFIECAESKKRRFEEIVRNLEAGKPLTMCSECEYYCPNGFDGGNSCSACNICWYDEEEFIFCKRYEPVEAK